MKTVLFVGGQNVARSQMAEAFLNYYAHERGLPIRAESAGVRPGFAINLLAEDVMNEMHIPLTNHHPKPLTPEMTQRAVRIISMGCGVDISALPPDIRLSLNQWDFEDIKGQQVETVRDIRSDIRWKVEDLLTELATEPAETSEESDELNTTIETEVAAPRFVRNLAAFDTEQKLHYTFLVDHLRRAMQAREDLPDGYAYILLADTSTCVQAMEFVTMERHCCPFLSFRLEIPSEDGPLTLSLIGPEGAKELLADFLQSSR
jgi:arsenate reductase